MEISVIALYFRASKSDTIGSNISNLHKASFKVEKGITMQRTILALIISLLLGTHCPAAEVVQLTPRNWDQYVPQGKEIDAIYGDYVIRNDVLTAVIAQPKSGRNANLTVRNVYGGVLDLTRLDDNNDQLSCFYPTNQRFTFTDTEAVKINHFHDLYCIINSSIIDHLIFLNAIYVFFNFLNPG